MFNTIISCCSKNTHYRPQRVKSFSPFGSGYVRTTLEPKKADFYAAKVIGVVSAALVLIAGITALVLHGTVGLPQTFQLITQLDPGAIIVAIVVPVVMTGITSFVMVQWGLPNLCKKEDQDIELDSVLTALEGRQSIYLPRSDWNAAALHDGDPTDVL